MGATQGRTGAAYHRDVQERPPGEIVQHFPVQHSCGRPLPSSGAALKRVHKKSPFSRAIFMDGAGVRIGHEAAAGNEFLSVCFYNFM